MSNKTITRFAPSPTGYLHIGSLRTALFNYLWAKHNGGTFKLRIEDTDQSRKVEGADTALIAILNDFGIKPDGEIVYQSARVKKGIYKKVADALIQDHDAYYCFCTSERLEEMRKRQMARKQAPGYDGTCRDIPVADAQKRISNGESATVRLRVKRDADNETVIFNDGIHGKVSFTVDAIDDAIILKSDGFPTYHLASVVDDTEMGVTDVIRGEEWLPSAPLHAQLYDALGYEKPTFWHVPLILNPDKSKLSKRQGDVDVESYLKKGYLKSAIINYVAFLGWNPKTDRELFMLDELIATFEASGINKSGAIFDITKLNWYNNQYIKSELASQDDSVVINTIRPFLPHDVDDAMAKGIFTLFFERINNLQELDTASRFLFELPTYDPKLLIFKKSDAEKTKRGLSLVLNTLNAYTGEWTAINLDLEIKKAMERTDLSFGDVYWPTRVAVSGLEKSPPPMDILGVLGKQSGLDRIEKAITKL